MFIPISTIRLAIGRAATEGLINQQSDTRNLSWDNWGPSGTRIVQLNANIPSSISSLGSRAIYSVWQLRRIKVALETLTFVVHPCAKQMKYNLAVLDGVVDTRQELENARAFSVPICTSFPIHITQSVIVLDRRDSLGRVVLSGEGLVLVLPYHSYKCAFWF